MARLGYIPPEQFDVPKKTFAIMGALDAVAGIMQIFGATYCPGPLIILLLQAAIPVSMVISKFLVNAKYNRSVSLTVFQFSLHISLSFHLTLIPHYCIGFSMWEH